MKEETKKKLCKISKIVGFAITFGFAVFGALCAAMLIGNGGNKDDIKTFDTSFVQNGVRNERNIKPKRQDDNDLNVIHLEEVAFGGHHIDISGDFKTFTSGTPVNWSVYCLNPLSSYTIPYGYYKMTAYGGGANIFSYPASSGSSAFSTLQNAFANKEEPGISSYSWIDGDALTRLSYPTDTFYFYYDGSLEYYFNGGLNIVIELVDTLEVPPSSILKLPNNWSPFALITDQVTDDNRFGLLNLGSPSSATLVGPDVELTNILFRYRGVVYDKIHFNFNDASHSTGYVRSDGSVFDPLNQYAVKNVDTHVISLNYVSFGQSWTNREDKVVGSRYSDKALPESPVDGVMWYPALGQYYWVNGGNPTIEIIDLKSETYSGRYNGRYDNLNDLQLLELLSNYSASTLDIGDTGMVFDLMTTAFKSLTPILSIYILPGLTLGMILFVPLIGGIIVIIIKVIKK